MPNFEIEFKNVHNGNHYERQVSHPHMTSVLKSCARFATKIEQRHKLKRGSIEPIRARLMARDAAHPAGEWVPWHPDAEDVGDRRLRISKEEQEKFREEHAAAIQERVDARLAAELKAKEEREARLRAEAEAKLEEEEAITEEAAARIVEEVKAKRAASKSKKVTAKTAEIKAEPEPATAKTVESTKEAFFKDAPAGAKK